jgi:phage protein D
MPDVGVAPGSYVARPSFQLDGNTVSALSDGLQEMLVEETSAGLSRCEATVANWGPNGPAVGFLYFDRRLIDFGKTLTVTIGGGDAAGQIFEGRVMGMEGRYLRSRPPELLILAEDRLQDLRLTRRTRNFENISDADLFQQVGSRYGLQCNIDVSGPTYKVLVQVNQSDLAFLRDRARAIDAELWISGKTLNVQARNRRKTGDVTITFGQGLLEFSVLADLACQATGWVVSGWDSSGKQGVSHRSTETVLGAELNGDLPGGKLLATAIGSHDQQVVHELPFTAQEAQVLADGEYRHNARRFVTGTGVAEGDARLRVGTKLQLRALGGMFDGAYYVTRARHLFDGVNGYRTQFSVERAGIGTGS